MSSAMDVEGQFKSVDTERSRFNSGMRSRTKMETCSIVGMVFLWMTSLSALVLGAWAVWRSSSNFDVLKGVNSNVQLGSNPKHIPSGYSSASHVFSGTGYWSREEDMLYYRSDHGVVAYGSKVYLFGGLGNVNINGTSVARVLPETTYYDVTTDSFSSSPASMPEPRYRFGYARVNDAIYVFGGFTEEDVYGGNAVSTNDVLVYSIPTNQWQKLSAKLSTASSDMCCAAVGELIYCAGGYTAGYTEILKHVEVFDTRTRTFAAKATNMSIARGDCRAVNLQGNLFVVGGVTGDDYHFIRTTELYNTASKRWVPRANLSHDRGDFAMSLRDDGRVVVVGGESYGPTYDLSSNLYALRGVEVYIPEDDFWVPKAPLPEARFRFDCDPVGHQVLCFGGQPVCHLNPESCVQNGLKSVFSFQDTTHPNMYIFSNVNTTTAYSAY